MSDGWASRSHIRRLAEARRLRDGDEVAQVAKLHLPEHRVGYSKKLSLMLREKVCFLQCQWDEGVFDIAFGYGSGTEKVLAEFERKPHTRAGSRFQRKKPPRDPQTLEIGDEMNDNQHLAVMEKVCSGIEGFDDITCGGLPLGRTSLLTGGPGFGKTVLALLWLVSASMHHGMPGNFVAVEENACRVLANREETCAILSKASPARSRIDPKGNRMTAAPLTPSEKIEA